MNIQHTCNSLLRIWRRTARIAPVLPTATLFVAVSAAICALFVLVVLYLSQATAVATRGYETQRLEQVRDELRRQNALLEVESARLDSPARIEAEARRLGLVRAVAVQVVQAEPIAAKR